MKRSKSWLSLALLFGVSLGATSARAWILIPDRHSAWPSFCSKCWAIKATGGGKGDPYGGKIGKDVLERFAEIHNLVHDTDVKYTVVKDKAEALELLKKQGGDQELIRILEKELQTK